VHRGDLVAEIHFWNAHLAAYQAHGTGDLIWAFVRDLRADIRVLAGELARLPESSRPKALYGVSTLAAGASRLGFESRPLPPGLARRALSFWQGRVLGRVFRPVAGQARAVHDSQEVWMSYAALQERFGGHERMRSV